MKLRVLAAALLAGSLALTACGQEGSPGGAASGPAVTYTVATNVDVAGSPTFQKMKERGRIIVGARDNQPGLGAKDAITGQYSGFDIEMARMIAAGLGFSADKIDFKPVTSQQREDAIERGEVDYVVATYTINDERKKRVSFAGPYVEAAQDLLVRSDDTSITGPTTLQGKKVCSQTGSTSIKRVRDQALTQPENIVEFGSYSECVDALTTGRVDTVTTDNLILAGLAAQRGGEVKLVGQTFSTEPLGVGLALNDTALRNKVNDLLQAAVDDGTWQKINEATLKLAAEPPALVRY